MNTIAKQGFTVMRVAGVICMVGDIDVTHCMSVVAKQWLRIVT